MQHIFEKLHKSLISLITQIAHYYQKFIKSAPLQEDQNYAFNTITKLTNSLLALKWRQIMAGIICLCISAHKKCLGTCVIYVYIQVYVRVCVMQMYFVHNLTWDPAACDQIKLACQKRLNEANRCKYCSQHATQTNACIQKCMCICDI